MDTLLSFAEEHIAGFTKIYSVQSEEFEKIAPLHELWRKFWETPIDVLSIRDYENCVMVGLSAAEFAVGRSELPLKVYFAYLSRELDHYSRCDVYYRLGEICKSSFLVTRMEDITTVNACNLLRRQILEEGYPLTGYVNENIVYCVKHLELNRFNNSTPLTWSDYFGYHYTLFAYDKASAHPFLQMDNQPSEAHKRAYEEGAKRAQRAIAGDTAEL